MVDAADLNNLSTWVEMLCVNAVKFGETLTLQGDGNTELSSTDILSQDESVEKV